MKLIPVSEYKWTDDYSFMREMTCVDHPTALYSTKNPYWRTVHLLKVPDGDIARNANGECLCPFSKLAVIVDEEPEPETPAITYSEPPKGAICLAHICFQQETVPADVNATSVSGQANLCKGCSEDPEIVAMLNMDYDSLPFPAGQK